MSSVLLQKTPYGSFGGQPGGTLAKYQGKDLSPSVMDKGEEFPLTAEELARSLAERDAIGPPTVGPISIDPTDWLTPGGLAKVGAILKGVLAPAAAVSTAMLVGSRAAGPTSQLARSLPRQAGALLPEPYYHGTNEAFSTHRDGLIFLTKDPREAAQYAYHGGGNRSYKPTAQIQDESTMYDVIDSPKGRIIRSLDSPDSPQFLFNAQKNQFEKIGAKPFEGTKLHDIGKDRPYVTKTPEYEAYLRENVLDTSEMVALHSGANLRRNVVDVENTLNLTSNHDRKALPVLSDLDPKNNRIAYNIIESAKQGHFDWSNTKYEPFQKVWKEILIPQLQEKGVDSIKYSDYGHDTLAVFSNKNLKSVESLRLPTTSTAAQDEAIKNLSEAYGIDVSSMLRKSK